MKKLLVFMLILCMASMAGATLQISAHNVPTGGETWNPLNPADSNINLMPSEYLRLDIYTDTGLPAGFFSTWALIVNTTCGAIGSTGTINPAYDNAETAAPYDVGMVAIAMAYGDSLPPPHPFLMMVGVNGMWGPIAIFDAPGAPAGDWLIDDIVFHCETPFNDATIQLIELNSDTGWPTGLVYDTVIVHQIPEPATIALLCLGGLLLRKKK